MRKMFRTLLLLATLACVSGVANAGIIIVNRDSGLSTSNKQAGPCSETSEKVDSGIIITNVVGIIITNLTGIIITNAVDPNPVDCGIIITN